MVLPDTMTTNYRKHDDQPKAVEVKPVVVGSQPAKPKPKKCVSVIVERTSLFWWFIRGVSMGGGFALVWYALQAVM